MRPLAVRSNVGARFGVGTITRLTALAFVCVGAACADDAVLLCEKLEACGRLDVSTSECVAKLDEQTAAKVSSCAHCVANNECAVLAMGVCDVQCQ